MRPTVASQLLEFALVLPLLAVLAVGLGDFGAAFVLRDKLTNAAREGTRIGIAQPAADLTQSNPQTVQAIRGAVVEYLCQAMNGQAYPCPAVTLSSTNPCTPTGVAVGIFSWAYCLDNGGWMLIERQNIINVGGTLVLSTRLTISYPYTWSLGRVIQLLGGNLWSTTQIQVQSVMKNLT